MALCKSADMALYKVKQNGKADFKMKGINERDPGTRLVSLLPCEGSFYLINVSCGNI